jgi:formylmethanofuran dehydrogenase subunit C
VLTLTLRDEPTVPLETEGLSPDRLATRRRGEVEALAVWHGNRRAQVGDFFAVSGSAGEELRVEGDLRRVKFLGAGMTAGRMTIVGDAGMHTGAGMRGGELVVAGAVGDFAGWACAAAGSSSRARPGTISAGTSRASAPECAAGRSSCSGTRRSRSAPACGAD